MQCHKMILWARPNQDSFHESVRKAHAILQTLKEIHVSLSPNYLPAKRKADAKIFDGTYEMLEELFMKGVNKEGKITFLDLGHSVRFLSSKVEEDTADISLTIGVKRSRFSNTLIVGLPQTFPIYDDPDLAERVVVGFKKCCELFDPKWGCISNGVNFRRVRGYVDKETKMPQMVHWVNYFGEEMVSKLTPHIIEKAPVYAVERMAKGYFVELQESPIDDNSEIDVENQRIVMEYFGIHCLAEF